MDDNDNDNDDNALPEAIARLCGLTPTAPMLIEAPGAAHQLIFETWMAVYAPTDYLHINGRAILSCEDVSGTDFDGADLYGMEALNTDFSRAHMWGCRIAAGSADNADFSGADLSATDGQRLGAVGATFDNATLRYANWHRADLRHADMWCADTAFAKFAMADLRGADLRGANMQSADFWRADLRGVSWDERTCWEGAYVASVWMDDDLRAALVLDGMGYVLTYLAP